MGLRGPKPVNIAQLKAEALQWATFLYTLRDGQRGTAAKVEWGPSEIKRGPGIPRLVKRGVPVRSSKIVGVEIIPLDRKRSEEFIKQIEKVANDSWVISRPVFPNREAWEQVKKARTAEEIRRAADSIRRWAGQFHTSGGLEWLTTLEDAAGANFSGAIRAHALKLLRAKRLPNYPRLPSTNDDKRIQFFAKVLAGLTLGLAPATATKRLGHWRLSKDWAEKDREEFIKRHALPPGKSAQKERPK